MAVKEIGYNMMEWHDHSSSNTYFEKTHLRHYEVTKYDNELTKCRKVFTKYGHEFTANLHDPCIGGVRNGSVGKIDTPDFLQVLSFNNIPQLFQAILVSISTKLVGKLLIKWIHWKMLFSWRLCFCLIGEADFLEQYPMWIISKNLPPATLLAW